jgi:hypothetical protein
MPQALTHINVTALFVMLLVLIGVSVTLNVVIYIRSIRNANLGKDIHDIVHGALASQMAISSIALRRVAELSGQDVDKKAAECAERAFLAARRRMDDCP